MNAVNITSAYLGICIPDSCSPEAWEDIVNSLMNNFHVKAGEHLDRLCQSNTVKPMTTLDKVAL